MAGAHAHAVARPRPWLLHARARGVPTALVGWVALAGVVAIGRGTADTDSDLVAAARAAVPVLAGTFAAVLAAGCLAGHDEVEETTPRAGRRWRLLHALVLACFAGCLPAAGWLAVANAAQAPARLALVTGGLVGVAVTGAVLIGAARAWILVLGYVMTGLVLAPMHVQMQAGPARRLLETVTWPSLPVGTPLVLAASVTAAIGLISVAARTVRP